MINNFIKEISKLKPNSTFLFLKSYKNEYGEIADYKLVFNVSYQNALKKSVLTLQDYIPANGLEQVAKKELIDGYEKSLLNMNKVPFEELEEHYTHIKDESGKYIKGVKFHTKTSTIHLYGFVLNKKVITSGIYPKSTKRELTIVKDKLRKLVPVSKFRQFKIKPGQLESISVNNLVLEP